LPELGPRPLYDPWTPGEISDRILQQGDDAVLPWDCELRLMAGGYRQGPVVELLVIARTSAIMQTRPELEWTRTYWPLPPARRARLLAESKGSLF
jgi:hypothetical protein